MLHIFFDWSMLYLAFGAMCNAVMDTCKHHFWTSIFNNYSKRNDRWYNAEKSWRNKYIKGDPNRGRVTWMILGFKINKPVQFTDAWHFAKMLMVFAICGAIVNYDDSQPFWVKFVHFVLLGIIWNTVFTVFYRRILIKKKYRR